MTAGCSADRASGHFLVKLAGLSLEIAAWGQVAAPRHLFCILPGRLRGIL
jgi:hypothetical protein